MKRILILATAAVFTAAINVQAQNSPVGIVSVQDSVKSVQFGVIVSWNTEGSANLTEKNMTLAPGGISINPINWKRDDTPASVKENLGSLTVEGKLVTPGIADARVDTVRGSVVVSSIAQKELYAIPADGAAMFGPESYHLHDYGFFFNNLKQNVADRIKAFIEK